MNLRYLAVFSLLSLASLAGCAAQTADDAAGESQAEAVKARDKAFHLTATLGDVRASHAGDDALGLWTTVELDYQVSCNESLDAFSYALRSRDDGGLDLIVNAVGTRNDTPGMAHCMSIKLEKRSVTVPGILSKGDINLVNLEGTPAALLETTKSLEPIGLRIESTRSLCPPNAMCIHGGTAIRLITTTPVSCVDNVAPIAYAVEPSANGTLKLAVGAIRMVDERRVRCISRPAEVEIELPGVYAAKETIELTSVGGSQ